MSQHDHRRSRPRIYVAGPYKPAPHVLTSDREAARLINCRAAAVAGALVAANGGVPFVPHVLGYSIASTATVNGWPGGEEDVWVPAGLDFLADCDGMVLLAGWERSRGSVSEHAHAVKWEIPTLVLAPGDFTLPGFSVPRLAEFIRDLVPSHTP